ncbi:MAG: serine--tRNA ligase, partial [Candidatus Saccharimonadales bacterium]
LDEQRRDLHRQVEDLRSQRNQLSSHNSSKPTKEDIKLASDIKTKLAKLEPELKNVEDSYLELLLQVPNINDKSVPIADTEDGNEVISSWGEVTEFDFEPKNHLELGESLDLIDTKTASFTSGSRFYYLKNEAVLLEFALVQWLLGKYVDKGFIPVTTPQLVKEHMMVATGFFPAEENEIYHVNPEDDDLYLVGTSEVPLAGLHMKEPIMAADLPKRYVGFSTCFRREAGSYGKDTQGILRVHQFDKMEMYSFTHPDNSKEEHDFLLSLEEEILQELKLPYQVVNICSGDLGSPAAKKYDCEVWIPSQGKYRELTSCSNTTDYQSRRGGIKYRNQDGKLEHAHTLNGTAMASTRTIIAILENYQTKDGSVRVPEVLQPYINKKEISIK